MKRSALFAASCTLFACGAILDLPDPTLDPTYGADGGSGTPSGGPACTADLQNDRANCGACGHGCGAAECALGVCQAERLVDGIAFPTSTAVLDRKIYFTSYGADSVFVFDQNAAAPASVLFADLAGARVLRADDTIVYMAGNTQLVTCVAATGCLGVPKPLTSLSAETYGMALAESAVFVTSEGGHAVQSVDKTTGAVRSLDDERYGTRRLAVSGGSVFGSSQYGIRKYSVAGGTPDDLFETGELFGGVAVDTKRIYAGYAHENGAGDSIASRFLDNTPNAGTYAATGTYAPNDIVSDGSFVYWASFGPEGANQGTVFACPVTGCTTPLVIAQGVPYATGLSFDATHVYFVGEGAADGSNGALYRAVKPLP